MRSDDLLPLVRHMEWADALMWRAVPPLTDLVAWIWLGRPAPAWGDVAVAARLDERGAVAAARH